MKSIEFEKIYNEHSKKLFRVCMVFVKDENIASEMIQDIFCSIWERRKTIEIQSNWENYLYRAAKFKYYNYCRNTISKERSLSDYITTNQNIEDNLEDNIHYNQLMDKVDVLVEKLPPKRKTVYKLSREEGLTSKEISEKLKISEKTVKNQLTKSLTYIRTNLEPYMSGVAICLVNELL